MIKIGVITDEITQDFRRAAELANMYGLQGVEVRSVWDKAPQDLSEEDLRKMKSILDQYGLECYNIAGPVFKSELDSDEEYKEHIEILKRCIEVAKQLGSNNVRGFTFWRRKGTSLRELWDKILQRYREAAEIVEEKGIRLLIENEHTTYIGSGVELKRFIDALGSKNVRAIWDPCNAFFDPTSEPAFPDGYEVIRDCIELIHIKDGVRVDDERYAVCVPVGNGDVGIKKLFSALKRDNFNGYISLETHWRPEEELSQELMKQPGGSDYSSTGELASRICLDNIIKLLAKV